MTWTDDRERCSEAGISADVEFATKPELAARMLARLLDPAPEGTCYWSVATDAWHQHITLSMLATAFLAVTAHAERVRDQQGCQIRT